MTLYYIKEPKTDIERRYNQFVDIIPDECFHDVRLIDDVWNVGCHFMICLCSSNFVNFYRNILKFLMRNDADYLIIACVDCFDFVTEYTMQSLVDDFNIVRKCLQKYEGINNTNDFNKCIDEMDKLMLKNRFVCNMDIYDENLLYNIPNNINKINLVTINENDYTIREISYSGKYYCKNNEINIERRRKYCLPLVDEYFIFNELLYICYSGSDNFYKHVGDEVNMNIDLKDNYLYTWDWRLFMVNSTDE